MTFKNKVIKLNCFLSAAILIAAPIAAHEVVIISAPNCSGIYTDACGWGYFPPIGGWGRGGGGGGGGGGGSSVSYDDGTTGTGNNFNRVTPGCLREALFLQEVQSLANAGTPEGVVIMTALKDRLYNNGEWVKMQTDRIYHKPATSMRYRTIVHYMYNTVTGVVEQLKLKTSYELGCKGMYYQIP